MRVLPESLMLLLTAAIVAGQCLRPADQAGSGAVAAASQEQSSGVTISEPLMTPIEPSSLLAMTPTARFEDPCPGENAGRESLADAPAVAIMPLETNDII